MIHRRLIKSLARISSRSYQLRYVVHGAKDEYALHEELIDAALGDISWILNHPETVERLTTSQQISLVKCAAAARAIPLDSLGTFAEVIDHPEWIRLRTVAIDCLYDFGMTVDEINAILHND